MVRDKLKQQIKALIVDDEPLARDALRVLLVDDPDIKIVGEGRNGREAVTMIREHAPDLVFLDVQMPYADGFQVLEQLDTAHLPVIVFVTAYDEYALRAFESHALDYLLKPFDHERFDNTLQRAKRQIQLQSLGDTSRRLIALLEELNGARAEAHGRAEPLVIKYQERLAIKSKGRIFFLKVEDIDWIEATGDYMRLHVGERSYLLRETMNDLAAKLDPEKFPRIHRSTIVNIERVRDIQPLFKGEHAVTLKDGTQLKLSRGYRNELQSILGHSL